MEALRLWLRHLFSFYLSTATASATVILRFIPFSLPKIQRFSIFVKIVDSILSLYFRYCDLSPCTVDVDEHTTMHFWAPNHRRINKPNLILIHGYGGNAKWQFMYQVGPLSQKFNVYLPDLLFFGDSYTKCGDRTDVFQAKSVYEGLRRLGVERCTVYAISYGGFVGYRMAEIHSEMVEKVVIVSSGIGCSEDQKGEQLRNIGRNALDLLLPESPQDLRLLVNLSIYKFNPFKWVPDMFLQEFINVMCNTNRKEKKELVEHLLANKASPEISVLKQDVLLVWGDKDNVFPLIFAHQLQRKLGPKVRLEIIKDTGHAANIESSGSLNHLIKAFVFSSEKLSTNTTRKACT